jgi:hypothetical protein
MDWKLNQMPMHMNSMPNDQRIEITVSRRLGARRQRPQPSIAKLPERITMHRKMHRIYRAMEHPVIGMVLERPEPCERKHSRTVLRGVWAG